MYKNVGGLKISIVTGEFMQLFQLIIHYFS